MTLPQEESHYWTQRAQEHTEAMKQKQSHGTRPTLDQFYRQARQKELEARVAAEAEAQQHPSAPPLSLAERQRRAKWEAINKQPYPTEGGQAG